MSQVRVTLDDSPVHCIDVLDTTGQRQLRIRPTPVGVLIEYTTFNPGPVWLSADDADDLANALSRAARRYPPEQEKS